jgi:hypothetical protein
LSVFVIRLRAESGEDIEDLPHSVQAGERLQVGISAASALARSSALSSGSSHTSRQPPGTPRTGNVRVIMSRAAARAGSTRYAARECRARSVRSRTPPRLIRRLPVRSGRLGRIALRLRCASTRCRLASRRSPSGPGATEEERS